MFPENNITLEDIETLSTVSATMGKVFLFDFDTRQYVLVNGKPVIANYEQAIVQWITFLLTSETDTFAVYKGTSFGISLKQFIGNRDVDKSIIESEIERQLIEKLILHPEIINIEEISFTRDGSKAMISFNVITKKGVINGIESEVIYSG